MVTIIIRTIGGTNIDKAIFSIYCNSYADKEIIVVYQGINAEYIEYLNQTTAKYPGIIYKIIHNPDVSFDQRAKNLNLGIAAATGRYIGFLDDDDEMYPTHIETHMNALKTSDSMWSVGQYCIKTVDKGYTVSMKNIDKISHMTLEQFYYRNYIPINTYIIDRDRFNNAGLELKFLEHMIYLEDYAFLLNTFIKNKIKPAKVLSATINYTKTQNKSNKQLLCKSYVDILPIIQSIPKNIFFGITSTLFWNIKRLIKQCT